MLLMRWDSLTAGKLLGPGLSVLVRDGRASAASEMAPGELMPELPAWVDRWCPQGAAAMVCSWWILTGLPLAECSHAEGRQGGTSDS